MNDVMNNIQPDLTEEELQKEFANLPESEQRYIALVTGIQKVVNDVNQWLAKAQNALHNHNVRLNVIETILTHPDFVGLREKLILPILRNNLFISTDDEDKDGYKIDISETSGSLAIQDFHNVAQDFIAPQIQKQAEEMEAARLAFIEQQKQSEENVIVDPSTGEPAAMNPVLLTPDGRKIICKEN
jgi:hypothetical protein